MEKERVGRERGWGDNECGERERVRREKEWVRLRGLGENERVGRN